MEQVINQFKGLYTAADDENLSLEYAKKFHNIVVKQGFIENRRYEINTVENDNVIAAGKCYLADYLSNKVEDDYYFIPKGIEELIEYNYKIYQLNNEYYADIYKDVVNIISFNIGNINLLGEYNTIVNTNGELHIYFDYDIFIITYFNRYRRKKIGYNYINTLYGFRISLLKKAFYDLKLKCEITKENVLLSKDAKFLYKKHIDASAYNSFANVVILSVSVNDKLVNTECERISLTCRVVDTVLPLTKKIDLFTSRDKYDLFGIRAIEQIGSKWYYTGIIIPKVYYNYYFEDKYSNGIPIVLTTGLKAFAYVDIDNVIERHKVLLPDEHLYLPIDERYYKEVDNTYSFGSIPDSGFINNTSDNKLVYKPYNIETIGIEKPGTKKIEIIQSLVINNFNEIHIKTVNVPLTISTADKFGISCELETEENSFYYTNLLFNKIRYYIRFNYEEPELVYEVDFLDREQLKSKDFLITKANLTGITLLNNVGLTLEDFEIPIIPTEIKKINNVFIGYKEGELYLSNYGSGRMQSLYYYQGRIIDNIKEKVITYERLNNALAVFNDKFIQTFVIQSDKAGDIILFPSVDTISVGITNKYQVSGSSEKLFVLYNKGIIVFDNTQSKVISTQIQNVIEQYYKQLFIHYDNYNKQLLVFSILEKLIYIYDETTETWSTIDFEVNYSIEDLINIKSDNGKVILTFKDNKTFIIDFNKGLYRQAIIRFPKTSFGAYDIKKYISNLVITTNKRSNYAIMLNGKNYLFTDVENEIKSVIPYKDRKPFSKLDLEISFRGSISTIKLDVNPAGYQLNS